MIDYASRLDAEETTRRYINSRKYEMSIPTSSSSSSYRRYNTSSYDSPFSNRYDYYGAMKHERDFMYDTRDVASNYKHYRWARIIICFLITSTTREQGIVLGSNCRHYLWTMILNMYGLQFCEDDSNKCWIVKLFIFLE